VELALVFHACPRHQHPDVALEAELRAQAEGARGGALAATGERGGRRRLGNMVDGRGAWRLSVVDQA
jgi:hypothetical protein